MDIRLFHVLAIVNSADMSISSVQSCPTLCDPMNCGTPGLPVHHQLPEFSQTHAHRVGDALQTSHPLSSPSPPAPNPSQHQGFFPMSQLFAWSGQSIGVSSSTSALPMNTQGAYISSFLFKRFYWSLAELQCCVSFCCIAKWISYAYTYIHFCLDSFPV